MEDCNLLGKELIRLAEGFPEGMVLERRGNKIKSRVVKGES